MDKEAGSSSQPKRYPNFFQDITDHNLEAGTLEILPHFVKKYETHWPKYACIEVPGGKMWKVEVKSCGGRVWLDKGWQQFVKDCSIKSGYRLMFRYEGASFFHVVIFDASHSEIKYPRNASANQRVNLDQPKVTKIKEEDNDDDSSCEILDEDPKKSREASVASQSRRDEEIVQGTGLGAYSARDGVLQRARAFQTPHPYFFVIMEPAYESQIDVPECFGISYFKGRNDDDIYLLGPDERAWPLKYSIGGPPLFHVAIDSGWTEFVQGYHLQDGDACIFELINTTVMAFNITVFQIAEGGEGEEDGRNNIHEMPSTPHPTHATRRQLSESECNNKPSFTAVLTCKAHERYKVNVPLAHGSKYLSGQHNKQVFLHGVGGQTWPVKCYISEPSTVRFTTGWKDFVLDNKLYEGDKCVFELLSQSPTHYNVTLIRTAAESSKPSRASPRIHGKRSVRSKKLVSEN